MTAESTRFILCPICGGSAKFAYDHPDSEIWRCRNCTHAFTRLDTMSVVEGYSTDYYDDEHKKWFENPNTALFEWICANIPDDAKSVLDIGCGRGDFLQYLHMSRPDLELVGIDLSPNENVPGITFVQNNIMNTEIERQFDVVVSLAAIEHMEDPLSFSKKLEAYCTPGGLAIVMTVNEAGIFYMLARLGVRVLFNRLYSAHHLNHFSVKSLKCLLNHAGMSVEKIHHHNSPLAAIDMPAKLAPVRWPILGGVAIIFMLGKLTSMCLLQTVIARARHQEPQQ